MHEIFGSTVQYQRGTQCGCFLRSSSCAHVVLCTSMRDRVSSAKSTTRALLYACISLLMRAVSQSSRCAKLPLDCSESNVT